MKIVIHSVQKSDSNLVLEIKENLNNPSQRIDKCKTTKLIENKNLKKFARIELNICSKTKGIVEYDMFFKNYKESGKKFLDLSFGKVSKKNYNDL